MRWSTPILIGSLMSVASADFFVSNTSVCMGTFIVQSCYIGVKVLSGVNNVTDYTCSHLVHAEDNNYIHNGTAGPWGDGRVSSEGGICDSGRLDFVKDGEGYMVNNPAGEVVGNCVWDNSTVQHCNQWVGMLFFQSMYRCQSQICG